MSKIDENELERIRWRAAVFIDEDGTVIMKSSGNADPEEIKQALGLLSVAAATSEETAGFQRIDAGQTCTDAGRQLAALCDDGRVSFLAAAVICSDGAVETITAGSAAPAKASAAVELLSRRLPEAPRPRTRMSDALRPALQEIQRLLDDGQVEYLGGFVITRDGAVRYFCGGGAFDAVKYHAAERLPAYLELTDGQEGSLEEDARH